METAAHPRTLFKSRSPGMMSMTFTSSALLRTGVVKTFRCADEANRESIRIADPFRNSRQTGTPTVDCTCARGAWQTRLLVWRFSYTERLNNHLRPWRRMRMVRYRRTCDRDWCIGSKMALPNCGVCTMRPLLLLGIRWLRPWR